MYFAVCTKALLHRTVMVQDKQNSPGSFEILLNSREHRIRLHMTSNVNGGKGRKKGSEISEKKCQVCKLS